MGGGLNVSLQQQRKADKPFVSAYDSVDALILLLFFVF